MNRPVYRHTNKWLAGLMALAILLMPVAAFTQTQIVLHSNKYQVTDDVKLGRQAAAEAERQFPLLRDAEVNAYVERIGQRLVASIPREFQHPEFHYYFKVVNARDINAFALPGGPMYVNRGMIEAARTEVTSLCVTARRRQPKPESINWERASPAFSERFSAAQGLGK
jgi:predicted Zn-dependent protease